MLSLIGFRLGYPSKDLCNRQLGTPQSRVI
jgi:hypothetical protein